MHRVVRSTVVLLAFVALAPGLTAQTGDKRPLEIADYRLWRTIDNAQISNDGSWVSWTYAQIREDDHLVVQSVDSDRRLDVDRAFDATFSPDSRWIAYRISAGILEEERLVREDEPVPARVGLRNLATGEERRWEDVWSFGFNETGSHFWVKKRISDGEADQRGTDLILRHLQADYEELIGRVDEMAFDDDGSHLAYTVDVEGGEGNGLYLVDLDTGARRALDNAEDQYARLTWAEDGQSLAVLRGSKPDGSVERENVVVAFTDVTAARPERHELSMISGLHDGWVVSEKGNVVFSEDASTLFVGTKPQVEELGEWGNDGLPLADVNIWHWQDDRIQSQQQNQLSRDKDRTYVAAVHLESGRLVHLADERMQTILITPDGRWGIGFDGVDYVSDWQPSYSDIYRVDTESGERTPVLTRQLFTLGISPDSEHFLYWKDGNMWDYRIDADEHVNLTASADVDFTNQEFDRFGEKPPYGVAGFVEGGAGVVLNHRYDLYLQPFDGDPAENMTGGFGSSEEVRLRYVTTDPDAEEIDLNEPVLLEGYGQWTKDEGFFELDGDRLQELVWEDARFNTPRKARDADRFLFTVQTWEDFPDLWTADGRDFADRRRISDANPQQSDFLWGSRILFDYTLADGTPLQGTLAIPETYTEGEQLPMVVRFYEKYSQDLHLYPTPIYRHQPNFAGLVSNGFLLMQPDIHFRIGSSHSDMLEAVEAATQKVIDMGYADPDAIGLSGHSYSGGGSAYIATRSDMFAAIAHGAAPINLVSEFNQLFVGSGQNNHGYDIYGQGRYATDPYTDFDLYWRESPISGVENMNTPVLYLHGEADGVVNWEQGLEWYNALRFLEKPIIWLSYPDEGHGLAKLQNKVDFQFRLQDFYNHHLKGTPAPPWMTDGVPQVDKERHLREYAPGVFRPRLVG